MSDLLHIGEQLGSLTTQSQRHSQRLDTIEADMKAIKAYLRLMRRVCFVIVLWGGGLVTASVSPEIGRQLAPLLKQILTHVLTKF